MTAKVTNKLQGLIYFNSASEELPLNVFCKKGVLVNFTNFTGNI